MSWTRRWKCETLRQKDRDRDSAKVSYKKDIYWTTTSKQDYFKKNVFKICFCVKEDLYFTNVKAKAITESIK